MAIRFAPYNRSTPFGVPDYAGAAAADDAVAAQNRARMSGEIGGGIASVSALDQAKKSREAVATEGELNRESHEKMMELFSGAKEGDSVTADQLRAMDKVDMPEEVVYGGGATPQMTAPTTSMSDALRQPAYDPFAGSEFYDTAAQQTAGMSTTAQEVANATTAQDALGATGAVTDAATATDAASKASGGMSGAVPIVGGLGAAAQLAEGDVGGAAKTGLSTYLSTLGPYGMAAGLLMNLF
jgi:hypothetical protein